MTIIFLLLIPITLHYIYTGDAANVETHGVLSTVTEDILMRAVGYSVNTSCLVVKPQTFLTFLDLIFKGNLDRADGSNE